MICSLILFYRQQRHQNHNFFRATKRSNNFFRATKRSDAPAIMVNAFYRFPVPVPVPLPVPVPVPVPVPDPVPVLPQTESDLDELVSRKIAELFGIRLET